MDKRIDGEIYTFINNLGLMQGDDKMLESIILIGTNFEYCESDFEDSSYYKFFESGIEYLFEKKKLSGIFFFIKSNDQYKSYSSVDSLIEGINIYSNALDVIKLLGSPNLSGNKWIKYEVNKNKYIHFEFDVNDELKQITLGLN